MKLKDKLERTQLRFYATFGGFTLFVVVSLVLGVHAFNSGQAPANVVEHADVVNVNQAELPPLPEPPEDVELGSLTSPDIKSKYLCVNDDCTYHITGSFIDASTTIVSVANPFLFVSTSARDIIIAEVDGTPTTSQVMAKGFSGATSTVELVRLIVTGAATSTYGIGCASSPYIGSTSSISSPIIDTSVVTNTFMIESGVRKLFVQDDWYSAASTSIQKIYLTPAKPYLICTVGGVVSGNSAFTNPLDEFDGKFTVRISRTR